jgi:apolipoprotein N-acyltransferase
MPGIAAWLWERACAVTARIEDGALVLERRTGRTEIPCAAIDRVIPWTVPLPANGVWLRLRSGRRFRYGLQVGDPIALTDVLVDAGAAEQVRAAARGPIAMYAQAKNGLPRRWYHPLLKFPVFALVPTLPIFRLNQWVAYGGTFGEYYIYGLHAYLLGFAIYWGSITIYLVLYAGALRAVAEAIALPAAWLSPARARSVRRAVEIAARVLYYGAVPAVLIRLYVLSR